jgi:hypothetical protein
MRVHHALVAAAMGWIAACTENPALTTAAAPVAAISDGATGGNAHFYFLPPMVPNPSTSGTADATLSPAVVICAWIDSACETILATFTTDHSTTTTTQPGNSETVRASQDHYIVDWHTRGFDLDPALTYRICVKVGDVELGFADVDVVDSGRDLQDVAAGFVAVRNGRTLPIKFRIEQGALDEPIASCAGEIE